jgi:hypothetical protein
MNQGVACSCGFFLVGPLDPFDIEHIYHKNHEGKGHTFVWLSSWEMVWDYWTQWKRRKYGEHDGANAGNVHQRRSISAVL